ncbi:MAG TPA: hypothetical protein VMS17_06140 [Gemmataceae bacterium]|nr:hypothetical protein [Gemmataceae bacterium]
MQRTYASDGLAAVSVSLDKASDADAVDRVRKFLRTKDADFTNLLLDEPDDVWSERLQSDLTPIIFVFDRDGRIAGKFEGKTANYEQSVAPLVKQLLKK